MPVAIAAAIPELFPAIAVMLIVWAAVVMFQKPLVALLGKLPVVGGAIAKAVGDAIGALVSWARAWAATMVLPLLQILSVPVDMFLGLFTGLVTAAEALIGEIGRVASVAAGAVGRVATDLAGAIASGAALAAVVNGVRTAADATRALLAATIGTTIPNAIAGVQAWARGFATALVDTASAALRLAISAAAAGVMAALLPLVQGLQTAFGLLPAWVQLQVAQAVAVLAGTVGIRLTGLEGLLGRLQGQVAGIEGNLAQLAPLSLAIAFPALLTAVRTMESTCVIPTCNALTPRLPLLNALGSGIMLYAVIDMASSAIRDPEGTARETAQLAGTITGLVDDLVAPITGVHVG